MLAHGTDKLTPKCQTCKFMIMTSGNNHNETVDFFKSNNYFGGLESSFIFFQQAMLPAIDHNTGKILMKDKNKL